MIFSIMTDIVFEYQALKASTYRRLLSINKTIRDNRTIFDKNTLNYYKGKRKETDRLLSSINNLSKNDIETFNSLKQTYMSFNIK